MGFCQNCGTELADGIKYCPNCGGSINVQAPGYSEMYTEYNMEESIKRPTSGLAIAGFILGIVGYIVPIVPSILAVVFGIIGMVQCRNNARKGKGFAIAAVVLGIVYFVILIILSLIVVTTVKTTIRTGGLNWVNWAYNFLK